MTYRLHRKLKDLETDLGDMLTTNSYTDMMCRVKLIRYGTHVTKAGDA